MRIHNSCVLSFFSVTVTATTDTYTLSLHDALPISFVAPSSCTGHLSSPPDSTPNRFHHSSSSVPNRPGLGSTCLEHYGKITNGDRKSTRLNSSHANISYAVFCLKKKKKRIMSQSL